MIDLESPPGSWRAALQQAGACARCRQHVCGHSDSEYIGAKKISVGRGYFALVDGEDFERLSSFTWHLSGSKKNRAARAGSDRNKRVYMVHDIMGHPGPDFDIDHINGDTLDNRRCNLRIATRQQNACNRGPNAGRPTKGVAKYRGRFQASVGLNGQTHRLGTFNFEHEAAYAHDAVAAFLHGSFAWLNYPSRPTVAAPPEIYADWRRPRLNELRVLDALASGMTGYQAAEAVGVSQAYAYDVAKRNNLRLREKYRKIVPASPTRDPSDDAPSAAVLSAADARRALRGYPPTSLCRAASTSVPPSHVQENARG